MRRRMILSMLAAALAAPAFAAEHGKKEGEGEAAPTYIDLNQVALPVIVNRRLVNYVFTQVRVNLKPGADPIAVRAKEPFIRDALVRIAHRTPFVLANDPNRIDDKALIRALTPEAVRFAGAKAVASVEVTRQAPRRRVAL